MPAMAPPDKPLFEREPDAAEVLAAGELEVADADGELVEKVTRPTMVGSTRPAHRPVALEL
jgi:hypothetical protein